MKKGTLIGLFIISDFFAMALFLWAIFQTPENGDIFSNPPVWIALGLFILVPIVWIVIYLLNPEISDAQVLRTGRQAYATVLEVSETRQRAKNGLPQVGLKLQVNPPDDSSFEAQIQTQVADASQSPYRAGMSLKVRYDPHHHQRVVVEPINEMPGLGELPSNDAARNLQAGLDNPVGLQFPQVRVGTPEVPAGLTGMTTYNIDPNQLENLPPMLKNVIQKALTDADHNGIPDMIEKAILAENQVDVLHLHSSSGRPVDPKTAIEKLEKLRTMGLLNQEQFDQLRARIESAAQQGPTSTAS